MGNNKFKFSDMIPNAWFYKLKDMSKSKKRNGSHVMKSKVTSPTTSQMSHSRYLNYFPNEPKNACKLFNTPIHKKELDFPFNDSPRRSSKRKDRRKTVYKPSPLVVFNDLSSIECSSESSDFNQYVSSESDCDGFSVNPDFVNGVASNCSCRVSSSTNDIIIDMMNNNESFHGNCEKIDDFDAFSTIGLAPILTKQVKFDDKIKWAAPESRNSTDSDEPKIDHSFSMKVNIEGSNHRSQRRKKKSQIVRKSSPNSPGIRLRVNSPKIGNRKIQACARKSVSSSSKGSKDSRNDARFLDGFAVVKSSIDPQSDFKESMVEMIVENNIRESKDLEDLLACYLSLNSSEYHDLIVKAFEQIWYDMAQLRM